MAERYSGRGDGMVSGLYRPTSDDRRVPEEIRKLSASVRDVQRATGTEKNRSLLQLQEALEEVEGVVNGLATTVAELSARKAATVSPANFTISTNTAGTFPTASSALFTFDGPAGGGRVATLAISAEFVRVTATGQITIWMELLQDGVVTWRRPGALYVGDPASAPPAWGNPAINDFIQIQVPDAEAAEMQIRLYCTTFVAGTVTARMQNIQVTLEYGPTL